MGKFLTFERRVFLDVRPRTEHAPRPNQHVVLHHGGGNGCAGADRDVLPDARRGAVRLEEGGKGLVFLDRERRQLCVFDFSEKNRLWEPL
jgi:hypothetical protein